MLWLMLPEVLIHGSLDENFPDLSVTFGKWKARSLNELKTGSM